VVVREAIERSPHRFARRHSVSLGLSETSVRRIFHKDLHFYPYKIQVTHALHERDYVKRVNPLNAELNPTCHLLALLGGSTIVVVSRLRVNFCQTFLQFEIHDERSQNCHRLCKTLSQQKHFVLQSTAPLRLKRFKVGSKMAIAESAPVLSNQKKQCCKIGRFTDGPCISIMVT
jgi:hypothetical protein